MTATLLDPPVSESTAPPARARRVLLIAYNFPPVGGAGVQRPAKWAKYLRRCGWDVTVLTTENPSVPVRDESLLADLPHDVRIVRARTWEPDYRVKQSLADAGTSSKSATNLVRRIKSLVKDFARRCVKLALQPDPQVLWNPNALRAGAAALREQPYDAILVTAPAYSSFLIGAKLKRRFGLPLILDYRDEWDLSGKYLENAQRDWFSRAVQGRMQRRLLRQADAVVATTQASTTNLANKLAALGHSVPAVCIYNGFDAEDFERVEGQEESVRDKSNISPTLPSNIGPQSPSSFRLVYTGTLWNLTDIEPLVKGVELLNASRPDLVARLELVCVGRKTPEQQQVLNRVRTTTATLQSVDYCDHAVVLDWLNSADGVCLLLSDVPGAERVVPAKLFEYLAIRKEMLAIAPHGETADIARRFFPLGHCHPSDSSAIAAWLEQRLANTSSARRAKGDTLSHGIDEFSRASQTARLAELLNELVTEAHR